MARYTRDEILAEIKRTSHNGVALGLTSFKNETGIGPNHWAPYWGTRWSDAVKEAGLKSQPWKSQIKDGVLVRQLIVLMRKLGKYPTLGEMSIYYNDNPKFNYVVINKRGKDYMLNAISDYCLEKPEHDDIREMIAKVSKTKESGMSEFEEFNTSHSYVYLFKERPGHFKVGKSDDPERRLSELSNGPYRPELIHKFETDDPSGVEAYWLRRFRDKKIQGEWFRLKPADVNAFRRWKKLY